MRLVTQLDLQSSVTPPERCPTQITLRTASGDSLRFCGVIQLALKFPNLTDTFSFDFIICENLRQDILIGIDLMTHYHFFIHPAFGVILFDGRFPIQFCDAHLPDQILFAAAQAVKIPPHSEKMIDTLPLGAPDQPHLVAIQPYSVPFSDLYPDPTVVPAVYEGVAAVRANQALSLLLQNPTHVPLYVPRHSVIAFAVPYSPHTCLNLLTTPPPTTTEQSVQSASEHPKSNSFPFVLAPDKSIPSSFVERLQALLHKYSHVFTADRSDVGTVPNYVVKLDPQGHPPIRHQPYKTTPEQSAQIREHLQNFLDKGIIEPSDGTWTAPVLLVPKPGSPGRTRLVVNYKKINTCLTKQPYPLVRLETVMQKLANARFFSILDLSTAYYALQLDPESRPYTGIATEFGTFQFTRLVQGASPSASAFSRFMNTQFGNDEHLCHFMDDLMIATPTLEQHLTAIERLFKKLHALNLRVNSTKSVFLQRSCKFYGFLFTEQGRIPLPDRLKQLSSIPPPLSRKQLKSALGKLGFYGCHVRNFAQYTAPLTDLLRGKKPFTWSAYHDRVWETLMEAASNPVTIGYPRYDALTEQQPFLLKCFTSSRAVSAELIQRINDQDVVIALFSKKLTDSGSPLHRRRAFSSFCSSGCQKLRPPSRTLPVSYSRIT